MVTVRYRYVRRRIIDQDDRDAVYPCDEQDVLVFGWFGSRKRGKNQELLPLDSLTLKEIALTEFERSV